MFEIGSTLRDARVRRDISLQRAEADTKIRIKYIQAMENEDFDILPAGTYVKGFLRTYAEYLGIDYQLILDEYNDRFGTGDHKEHLVVQTGKSDKSRTPRRPRKQTNYLFVAIFAIVIIAVLAYLGWGNYDNEQPTLVTSTESGAQAETTTVPDQPVETAPATAPPAAQSELIESLVLSADAGDSWVRVRKDSVDGDILWENVLADGETKTFTFTPTELTENKLVINLGSTLLVEVNGQSQRLNGGVYVVTATSVAELP